MKEIDRIISELKTESELEAEMSKVEGDLRETRGELNQQPKTVEKDIERFKKVDPNLKFTIIEDRQHLKPIGKFEANSGISGNKRRRSY